MSSQAGLISYSFAKKRVYLQTFGPVAQLFFLMTAQRDSQIEKLMVFVYVLRSLKDGRFYVGMTMDLDRRFREHNGGHTRSTRNYCPWSLFFFEQFNNFEEARKREKYLKSGVGKEFIKRKWSGSSAGYPPAGRQGATGQ